MLRVGIIIGSTRPGRKTDAVANWVFEIAKQRSDAEFEVGKARSRSAPAAAA